MAKNSDQLITVKQARELLGVKARGWSDARVEEHINQLDFIATLAIRAAAERQPPVPKST